MEQGEGLEKKKQKKNPCANADIVNERDEVSLWKVLTHEGRMNPAHRSFMAARILLLFRSLCYLFERKMACTRSQAHSIWFQSDIMSPSYCHERPHSVALLLETVLAWSFLSRLSLSLCFDVETFSRVSLRVASQHRGRSSSIPAAMVTSFRRVLYTYIHKRYIHNERPMYLTCVHLLLVTP